MLFNSEVFLVFAILFFTTFFSVAHRAQLFTIIVASYVFYGWWDWRFLSLIITCTLINFTAGVAIGHQQARDRSGRVWLWFSIAANLGILGFFKYFNFFIESLKGLLSPFGLANDLKTLEIILPVGISFYTFQAMSYTLDIYCGRMRPEPNIIRFAAYLALFPQLVAGPIVRAARLLPQMRTRRCFRWSNVFLGAELIIIGLFLKLVLADRLAGTVDRIFTDPATVNSLFALIGVIFFSFQIYGDFAGYSLIAIGLGRMMGFRFGRNFNMPYMARSFSEFWSRWHISLSSWLRDYLYFGLGGSRHGRARTFRNLTVTMLLGGLWHGAAWTFVAWGGLHGGYLVLQRLIAPSWERLQRTWWMRWPIPDLLAMGTVFVLTTIAWVFFRAESFADALLILLRIVVGGDWSPAGVGGQLQVFVGGVVIAMLVIVELAMQHTGIRRRWTRSRSVRSLCMVMLFLMIPLLGMFDNVAFIYFQF